MKFIFESVAEAQKHSLENAAGFTESFLVVVERLTKLNIDVSRAVYENYSEMTLLCLENSLAEDNPFAWNALVESGVERFARHCQALHALTQEAARAQGR